MNCRECGAHVKKWGFVLLCDRCLDARLYNELQADVYVLLRRTPGGNYTLARGRAGARWTNLTLMNLDPEKETIAAVREMLFEEEKK